MPTLLTHPAVPLAIGLGLGAGVIPVRLLLAGIVVSILPDLDVIAFHLGLPYAHDFGHRGMSHSLLFAVLIALLGAAACHFFRARLARTFSFLFLATASHGILDAFTTGGMGIAFFWPVSATRYFAPIQRDNAPALRLLSCCSLKLWNSCLGMSFNICESIVLLCAMLVYPSCFNTL